MYCSGSLGGARHRTIVHATSSQCRFGGVQMTSSRNFDTGHWQSYGRFRVYLRAQRAGLGARVLLSLLIHEERIVVEAIRCRRASTNMHEARAARSTRASDDRARARHSRWSFQWQRRSARSWHATQTHGGMEWHCLSSRHRRHTAACGLP